MKTETFKGGKVTYDCPEFLVDLAEVMLLAYFKKVLRALPAQLEDDFCGEPRYDDTLFNPMGRWRATPFFPALARLVDKGEVVYAVDPETEWVHYALADTDPIIEVPK